MSNTKTLELRTLDDEELLDVVGGGQSQCQPQCSPCERDDNLNVDIDINIDVDLCL